MHHPKELTIAYIGGGSRGWAWGFMTDLAMDPNLCGCIRLYDIDIEAAERNRIIGENVSFAPQPQSSMSIIDQHTGYVKAVIGGRGRKTASLTLNRATDTTRQPGSTFKILSTYAPALDECGMTLASSFLDEEYSYPDGSPVNNASRSYGGLTTIRDAIRRSVNVVAVKCLEQVTPEVGLKYLDDFGFTLVSSSIKLLTELFVLKIELLYLLFLELIVEYNLS